ncbi:hypothetical protein AAHE18_11G032700 [Arachis hypogaea]|uniref:Uncharacterized protein n=1 Tax=Arachis hypogaea TaxID=3818 RepID=A0A6B9V9U4_ARAHY|nr:uncharacterized protein DS421_19g648870 [Arachis hypogaea]QHO18496.1 uncharacterized protein DS421_11g321040 [Arachis hypogaea]
MNTIVGSESFIAAALRRDIDGCSGLAGLHPCSLRVFHLPATLEENASVIAGAEEGHGFADESKTSRSEIYLAAGEVRRTRAGTSTINFVKNNTKQKQRFVFGIQ